VSATTLEALSGAGHEIVHVVTRADSRKSRRGEPSATPVKERALALGLPVSHRVADILETTPDLGIVVAFGQLIRPAVLEVVPMLNVHFSLLPRWRGAAPVERAILEGDEETGVCIMALEETLDTGPVFARQTLPIDPDERADELVTRLGEIGNTLLLSCLANGRAGLPEPVAQSGEATYAAKITPEDRHLRFEESSRRNYARVRIGRAWTTFRGERLLVHDARPVAEARDTGVLHGDVVGTKDGGLRLIRVQQAGRGAQSFSDWAVGARPSVGERLGP
jgi:methionyl-tRNA formyltransferase